MKLGAIILILQMFSIKYVEIFAKITVGEKYCVVALFKYLPHKFQ